jgi:hypothetical protein
MDQANAQEGVPKEGSRCLARYHTLPGWESEEAWRKVMNAELELEARNRGINMDRKFTCSLNVRSQLAVDDKLEFKLMNTSVDNSLSGPTLPELP